MSKPYFYALGKRKTARATVKLFADGAGDVRINDQKLADWSDIPLMSMQVREPLGLLGLNSSYDVEIRTSGGGKKAQAVAAQLGIARAIIRKFPEYKLQLKEAGLLTRDDRRKERKKPGLKKARRAPQFSKR